MVIKIDGKEIQDAVIRTQQMELRILEIAQDRIEFEVKDIYGESFNFVPRFFKLAYSDGSVIAAKADQETAALLANETLEVTVVFAEALRFEAGMKIQMNYGFSTLAEITVE